MTEINIFSAFFIGIAGGVHCVGMCGGIVAALRTVTPSNEAALPYTLAYNFGRIISYTLAGAITGAVGQMATEFVPIAKPVLSLISGIMLLLLACYLGKWWQGLNYIEAMGRGLFKAIQPLSKRFLPFKSPAYALPYGFIWGWLPCGLVYSTLTWSLASGSAVDGAAIMLFFGLGTLPTLLAASAGSQYLIAGFRHSVVRQCFSGILAIYALFLIYAAIS
ncbi:sulfite exporter TauE/SafE family protein [Alteromonas stellipolaris]|uniref:sulfite exporter TauE/SafE family protein n=1 Tax=Alteromonas stellipolaris TaxID=233316 RepID=UPI0026E460BA|nr:sulfite exporter TauE/SafE family protein [Alteromonas stellipolaris]MDO6537881.1 sulfite exporter TauE/SafE family protein [Alteromonas stellipolaris]